MAGKKHDESQSIFKVPLGLALLSAALGVLVDYLREKHNFVPDSSLLNALIGAFIGGVVGVAYEVSRELRGTLRKLEQVSTLANARVSLLTALPIAEMLEERPSHLEVLCQLIGDSLKNVRFIANVDPIRYLTYLAKAIELSTEYEGIQRFPIRWFKAANGAVYLNKLRGQQMKRKVRLFLIEDQDKEAMQEDLLDDGTLSFYWQNTGEVASYWILVSELKSAGLPLVDDCALYDRRLLIQYDEVRRVLGFEFGRDGNIEKTSKLFSRLREQIEQKLSAPFHEVPRARASRSSEQSTRKDPAQQERLAEEARADPP
jgi:hypothetical protein